jgi:vitamin B12 transporter
VIDYVPTPYDQMPRKDNLVAGNSYALAKNIARVNTTGGELDIQYQQNFSKANKLYSAIGIVWMNSESSNAVKSFYISSHAGFMANFMAEYSCRYFSIAFNGVYKTRSSNTPAINAHISKDYFVLNSKIAVHTFQERLKLFLQVTNLFDKNYSDLLGAVMPGRWVMVGANLNMSK